MPRSLLIIVALLITLAVITSPASAADITVEFTALVDNVSDDADALGGSVAAGDTIRGTYRIDSNATDANGLPTVGDYWHHGGSHGMTASVSGWTFAIQPAQSLQSAYRARLCPGARRTGGAGGVRSAGAPAAHADRGRAGRRRGGCVW